MANTSSSQSDENFKPICHGSPRPLVELASMKMALHIWLQKFDEFYQTHSESKIEIPKLDLNIERLTALPTKISKMIDAQMYPIADELDKWVRYITLPLGQIYTRLNLVVIGGNGTVHFRDTVVNYLEDDSLDNLSRFQIACDNCVEEKIDFFWPLVSDSLSVDNLQFDRDFMQYYWICWKKGELDRIPLESFSCIERRMLRKCRSYCFHLGIEYFLKSMNTEDRCLEVNEVFDFGVSETFTRLFPNVDGPTQRQILDKLTTRVLDDFVICLVPVEYTVQCFLYISNIISPERYFHEIIIQGIKYVDLYTYTQEMSEKEKIFWCKQIETAMEQIWFNTPPHLKEYALQNLSKILDEYRKHLGGSHQNFGRDIRFLLALLSDCNFSLRNDLWIKYWKDWTYGVSPNQFEELMELCLKTEAIEEFKSTLPYTKAFQQYCDVLISRGYFIEFDTFLSSFYSNSELILNIKKHILNNSTDIFSKELDIIDKYITYIDNLFPDIESANEFKDRLIFSDVVMEVLADLGISGYYFGRIKVIVFWFLSPIRYMEIKNKFLEMFRDTITRGELIRFESYTWSEFLIWCTDIIWFADLDSDDNKQRMDEFMKSLQIDVIFKAAFIKGLRFVGSTQYNLCGFLIWFFKSKPKAKDYIRKQIEDYENMDAADVERIFGKDKQTVIDAMKNDVLNYVDQYDENPPDDW